MATIIDDTESFSRGNDKSRHIGCIALSGEMNQMLRSEEIINIKQRLEHSGWVIVNDFDQGEDQHVFIFELPESHMHIFPEKPSDDWQAAIGKNETLYLEADRQTSFD